MAFVLCKSLTTIYNYAVTPQEVEAVTFLMVPTAACTLYVPEESVELYKAAPVWKNFNVQAMIVTGVKENEKVIVNSEKCATAAGWFTLDGRRLEAKPTTKGIYINNGKKYSKK